MTLTDVSIVVYMSKGLTQSMQEDTQRKPGLLVHQFELHASGITSPEINRELQRTRSCRKLPNIYKKRYEI